MTLPAVRRNISPISIGRRPKFLSKGIKKQTKNNSNDGEKLSAVHRFLMTSAMDVYKSMELLPKYFAIKILFHPSAFSPDGPAPPLVLTASLFQHRLRYILLDVLVRVYLLVKHPTLLLCHVDFFVLTSLMFFNPMEVSCPECY